MKTARTIIAAALAAAAWATDAAAAPAGREDVSGLFVWAFLGLCALIVAAQVIPAILMMIGAARGVAEGVKEGKPVPAESRARTP
ncbi:MAG: hypothetical protein Kow0092_39110 [Deferrisomatales bacterium]